MQRNQRQAIISWLFVGALFVLCGVLGVLQYRWIGEVSVADRERRQSSLQASLYRLSQDFNSEISVAARALLPATRDLDPSTAEEEFLSRYAQWRRNSRHAQIFHRIAIAVPQNDALSLRMLNPENGELESAAWPADWKPIEGRLEGRFSPEPWLNRVPPLGPGQEEGLAFAVPLFGLPQPGRGPGRFDRRQMGWAIYELNLPFLRETALPELLQRHLGSGGNLEYQVEIVTRANPRTVIYQSDPAQSSPVTNAPDATVNLFEMQYEQVFRPWGSARGRERGPGPPGPGPGGGPRLEMGRWQMYVRHRAGSLEAVVSRARWKNLAVTSGVLLLMVASVAALIRFTRRAQKLAELQMDFVAGVSHELRTPLTVIHTAAYNLRGKLAQNPIQVERYGALIQEESGRLKELVEQVLRFAGAKAGRVIQEREPLSVETVIEETVASSKAAIQSARCVVEKSVDPELPLILGDPVALKQAFYNLVSNAAKYGSAESHWIGISASRTSEKADAGVEIRVADRGPGIPEEEQRHIFDPFFRGRRAIQDQVHGTGLGLNLVKKIVEAHGGTIRVKSTPSKGTEFIVRIPGVPSGVSQ